VFITLSDVFIKQGFTTALIQKKDADKLDMSSVFYANIGLSILLYAVFYFTAPFIAEFYKEPRLTSIMRVLCLNVIIGATSAVHDAIMSKNLEFKKSFVRSLSNTVTNGIVGIILAFSGFGVWSLVYSRLAGVMAGAIVLWITVKWHPTFEFSFARIKSLFKYSSKVLGTNLLNTLFNNINPLIIGKFHSSAALGYYQRGQNIPHTIMNTVDGSMSEVMYPTFSKLQSDLDALKSALRRSMKLSTYVVFPALLGLLAVSRPLTLFLLTEKWLPSVPYMQLTCIICLFWPLTARTHALNAIGKSELTFKLSLISKAISLVCLIISARFGVMAIMYGSIVASTINFFISTHFINKLLNYSYKELAIDILPQLALSIGMCAIILCVGMFNLNSILLLLIQVPTGIVVYILGSILFKIESYSYVLNMLKKFLKRKV
jgi:O-antigen/teichoic acid export membrane protein